MSLDYIWVGILHIQDMKFCFYTIQHPLTIQHALLKIGWFLEKLILCSYFTEFSLF